MDFGAIQCTPQSPRCLLCPLAESCVALRSGAVDHYPVKNKTLKIKTRYLTYVYVRNHGQVLMHRRAAGDIWQGLWEPVLLESDSPMEMEEVKMRLQEVLIANSPLIEIAKNQKHVLTHRVLYADFYLLDIDQEVAAPGDYQWIGEEDMHTLALSRLVDILLKKMNGKKE